MKKQLIEFYLDWVNNFLTVERLAEHYGLTEADCIQLTTMGKYYHEHEVQRHKDNEAYRESQKLRR